MSAVEVTAAAARELTDRAKQRLALASTAALAAVEDIATVIEGGGYAALGYDTPAAYLLAEFDVSTQRLDPAGRRELALTLVRNGVSRRAAAKTLGVSEGTVRNDLSGAQNYAPDRVLGGDGKTYPTARPARASAEAGVEIAIDFACLAIAMAEEERVDDRWRDLHARLVPLLRDIADRRMYEAGGFTSLREWMESEPTWLPVWAKCVRNWRWLGLDVPADLLAELLTVHPALAIVPPMNPEERQALAESIRQHGLLKPITLYQGQLLDGRERLTACIRTGVEPRFQTYDGDDPIGYVISLNVRRQHFTEDQRACMALEYERLHGGEP